MIKDMNGQEIKVGDVVKRYPLIGSKSGDPVYKTVKDISPMHGGEEDMVWFKEGGGAHHPQACEVVSKDKSKPKPKKKERLIKLKPVVGCFYEGQKLLIVSKRGVQRCDVKGVIPMQYHKHGEFLPPHDHEILINKSKNYYFSLNMLKKGESWVFDVYERE